MWCYVEQTQATKANPPPDYVHVVPWDSGDLLTEAGESGVSRDPFCLNRRVIFYRPARKTIADRGFGMIPLASMGLTSEVANAPKKKRHVFKKPLGLLGD
jgi:hypothetical protein